MSAPSPDPWRHLAARTPARVALGRAGASLPTREVLGFALAHAQARDAVHARLDRQLLRSDLSAAGLIEDEHRLVEIESQATDRETYLRRPDLGRRLNEASRAALAGMPRGPFDLAILIGDGLSATAVARHAPAFLAAFLPHVRRLALRLGPICLAGGARVALGDEVGACVGAPAIAVLIGERPGLSAPDSLGVYLTYQPRIGRSDAERNCLSNIRPGGLSPEVAAFKLAWLVETALTRRLTGVALKDESDAALPAQAARLRLSARRRRGQRRAKS